MRAFFQSNDIKTQIDGTMTLQNPYAGRVSTQQFGTLNSTCDGLGAGNSSDAFAFSGIFYADLGTTTYNPLGTGSIYQGDHYTQIYPYATPGVATVSESCLTQPKKNIRCYAEFPWVFGNGSRLLFEGGVFTSAAVIDACAALTSPSYCQPNYTDEWITNQLFTDYSQAGYPTTITAAAPLTNYNSKGTPACGQVLYALVGSPTNCGVFSTPVTFGGCGRMDVDEASGLVACANQTNRNEPDTGLNVPLNRTMVIPFAGGVFNPAVQMSGGISATGGIKIAASSP